MSMRRDSWLTSMTLASRVERKSVDVWLMENHNSLSSAFILSVDALCNPNK